MTAPPESAPPRLGALRQVPYMGVIAVLAEAARLGYSNGDRDWCNLGQGQPEPGEMPGAPPRLQSVTLDPTDHAYGPLEGLPELRARVAQIYNETFRQGLTSQYTADNVAVASGGRLALTRAMAALDAVPVGYQVPDYTAYEDMFNLHLDRLSPVPLRGREEDGFAVTPERVRVATEELGLGAYILSNPCNPTGVCLRGEALGELTALSRSHDLTLLSDEFYSHFIYEPAGDGTARPGAGPVSAAAYVEDVEQDPVLIFDGLTKNHRYPGWRVGWVIGPSAMVEAIARTASSIDGGPSRVAQRIALEALEPQRLEQETRAVREVFSGKRNTMVAALAALGVRFAAPSMSTFYCWGNVSGLRAPLNDGMGFFRRALQHKVLTVPGEYFDVNPGRRRRGPSPYARWVRFSFGPDRENMELGLRRLAEMVAGA